jgi:hypothetical protein
MFNKSFNTQSKNNNKKLVGGINTKYVNEI